MPHEDSNYKHTRDYYNNIDLIIGEVSYSSIGLEIELAFSYDNNIPIYLFHKSGRKYSKSLEVLTKNIIEYKSNDDLVKKLKTLLKEFK